MSEFSDIAERAENIAIHYGYNVTISSRINDEEQRLYDVYFTGWDSTGAHCESNSARKTDTQSLEDCASNLREMLLGYEHTKKEIELRERVSELERENRRLHALLSEQ